MCKSSPLHSLLAALPKCEHHLHLEGCLSPSLTFQLAAKNSIALPSPSDDPAYTSVATLTERYANFANLNDFLGYYYRALDAVITRADFEMLGWEYFTTAARDGVAHAEVFFDPQSHTARGISLETVVAGFDAARKRAEKELGITSKLIMCFLRHLPVQESRDTMAAASAGGAGFERGRLPARVVRGDVRRGGEEGDSQDGACGRRGGSELYFGRAGYPTCGAD
jgi:adenosine deaminase